MKRILALLVVGLTALAPVTAATPAPNHAPKAKAKLKPCPGHMPGGRTEIVTIHYTYTKPDRKVHCVSIVPPQTILKVGGWLWFVNDSQAKSAPPPFVLVLDPSHHEDPVPFQTEQLQLKLDDPRSQFKVKMAPDCKPHPMRLVFLASKDKADRLECDCPERLGILGNPQVVVDGSGD